MTRSFHHPLTYSASLLLCTALSSWACGTGTSTITNLFDAAGDTFQVTALNSGGQFTGYFQRSGHQPHAFLYSNNGGIIDLGSLGGDFSQANAINNLGQVVGSSLASDSNFHPFLYSGGVLSDLGTLGGSFAEANALNDAGQVVGDALTTDDLTTEAFLSANGTLSSLGTLGGDYSSAFAINSSGMICGESSIPVGDTHGFVYMGGAMSDVGTLGGHYSSSSALNDAGTVVGESWIANGNTHAFSYSGGTMADLGTLGGTFSSASAVNNGGQIIGLSSTAAGQFHGFVYSAGAMVDLGTLGGTSSQANAINNHGQVVGKAAIASGINHAFLWQNGTMVDLNTLLPANSGWQLLTAVFINDTGRVLGTGLYNGVSQWFILDLASENHPPIADAGANQTVDCQASVTLDASHSSDPDGDSLSFEWSLGGNILGTSPTLTVSLPLGANVVTLKVNDPCGGTGETNVVVTVTDTTAPTGSCPSDATASSDANCQATVPDFVSQVVASDNCTPSGALAITQDPTVGTLVGLGPHPVSLTVSDASGNSSTCTVVFTVVDTTAPSIVSTPGPITLSAVANQAAVPNVVAGVVATDNCTAADQLVITQSPAAGILLGPGQYTITVTVTDASSNSASAGVPLTITASPAIAYRVLQLGNGKVSISSGGVYGDVAVGPNGTFAISGPSFVAGTLSLSPGDAFSRSGSAVIGNIVSNADLSASIDAALATASADAALPCTQTFTRWNSSMIIWGGPGTNVICVQSVALQAGGHITLMGSSAAKFIINVPGSFTMNGDSTIRVGGCVHPTNVTYNVIGTGNDVALTGRSGVDGTILAASRNVSFTGSGVTNGRVISGKNVAISGPRIN